MINSLANLMQCEENDVIIDLHPKVYYPNYNNAQSITFPNVTPIPVEYNGVLPCIAVCRPNKYEVENSERIALTSIFDWDPNGKVGSFSKVEAHSNNI